MVHRYVLVFCRGRRKRRRGRAGGGRKEEEDERRKRRKKKDEEEEVEEKKEKEKRWERTWEQGTRRQWCWQQCREAAAASEAVMLASALWSSDGSSGIVEEQRRQWHYETVTAALNVWRGVMFVSPNSYFGVFSFFNAELDGPIDIFSFFFFTELDWTAPKVDGLHTGPCPHRYVPLVLYHFGWCKILVQIQKHIFIHATILWCFWLHTFFPFYKLSRVALWKKKNQGESVKFCLPSEFLICYHFLLETI